MGGGGSRGGGRGGGGGGGGPPGPFQPGPIMPRPWGEFRGNPPYLNRGPPGPPGPNPPPGVQVAPQQGPQAFHLAPYHFDLKLKHDDVPEWDGEVDTLLDWIETLNQISLQSNYCFEQLGLIAPQRFSGRAATWWNFLLQLTRDYYQQNWQTLKEAIATHYLTRNWYNTQKSRALAARYRQPGYSDEKPTEFLYRKVKLLNTIGRWTLIELIIEVMRSCPQNWNTILNTANMTTLEQLANEMEYHDVVLMDSASRDNSDLLHQIRKLEKNLGSKHKARTHEVEMQEVEAEVNVIGQKPASNPSNNFIKPKPPPADHVVSKGKTPIEAGGRPC